MSKTDLKVSMKKKDILQKEPNSAEKINSEERKEKTNDLLKRDTKPSDLKDTSSQEKEMIIPSSKKDTCNDSACDETNSSYTSKELKKRSQKKRVLKFDNKSKDNSIPCIEQNEFEDKSNSAFISFFQCIYSAQEEEIIDEKFIRIFQLKIKSGDIKETLSSLLLEGTDLDSLCENKEILETYLNSLKSEFGYALELSNKNETDISYMCFIEEKLQKSIIKSSFKDKSKNCDELIEKPKQLKIKCSLNNSEIIINEDRHIKFDLMRKYSSLNRFLQNHFENWIKLILLSCIKMKESDRISLNSIKAYIINVKNKLEKMHRHKRYSICGPFISFSSLNKIFNLRKSIKQNKFDLSLKSFTIKYLLEILKVLDLIQQSIAESTIGEVESSDESEVKEVLQDNDDNESNIDLCTLIRKLEKRILDSSDKRTVEYFCKNKKYIFESGSSYEYITPDLKSTKLVIPKECIKEVQKDLKGLFLNVKNESKIHMFDTKFDCREQDKEKLKPIPLNFKKIKNCNEVMKKIKNLDKADELMLKNENDKQIKTHCHKLLKSFNKCKEECPQLFENVAIIKDFDWNNINKLEDQISNHINEKEQLSFQCLKDCKYIFSENIEECLNQQAEIIFGSGNFIKEVKLNKKSEKESFKNLIFNRLKGIQYILKNPILTGFKNSKVSRDFISFIIHEMENNDINTKKSCVIGEQSEIFLSAETIMSYPFESLMKCNSTKGRLFLLDNWEKFSNMESFGNQTHYGHIFGFVHNENESTKDNLYTDINKMSRITKEIKVHLFQTIRKKILNLIKELKPIILFRFLIEKNITGFGETYAQCKSEIRYSEEVFYQLILCYMCVLNYLKRYRFDIDKCMRLKISCGKHYSFKSQIIPKYPCLCVYLLDHKTFINSLFDQCYREKEAATYKCNFFMYQENSQIWEVKDNKKQFMIESSREIMKDIEQIKTIEKSLNLKLDWMMN